MTVPTLQCIQWRNDLLSGVSPRDEGFLRSHLDDLDQKVGYVAANAWLRGAVERYQLLGRLDKTGMGAIVAKEADRRAKRDGNAVALEWLRGVVDRLYFADEWITDLTGDKLASWAQEKSRRFEMSAKGMLTRQYDRFFDFIQREARSVNATFDKWDDLDKVHGLMLRMFTPEWWMRQAKRHYRAVENVRRECGQVCNQQSPYISRWGIHRHRKQKQANRAFLESWEATNQFDQSFLLSDLAAKSISNPVHTKAELSVRVKGLQYLAVEHGHIGWFITMTCPSKYHPVHKKTGYRNKKFYDFGCPSPRDAQEYLNGQWRKIRAACARAGVHFYGLRTVEPHHDGTPHWHLIIFVNKEQSAEMISIMKKYAYEVDGNERGADYSRFVYKFLDPAKGGAASYVAKYIAKNIDGLDANGQCVGIDKDTGRTFVDAAERVQAWKSRFGIRQFQFLGGVSITVWREIRRLKDSIPETFTKIYDAAKANDWKRFTELMGGVAAGRNQTLKPLYNTGEKNQFGEVKHTIEGVFAMTAEMVITRLYEWTVQRVGSGSLSLGAAKPFPRNRVNNCTGGEAAPYPNPIYH